MSEVKFLQDTKDGALVMFPAGEAGPGSRFKMKRAIADEYQAEGEVLQVTKSGQAIARIPKRQKQSAPIRKAQTETIDMQNRLETAATMGEPAYGDRGQWAKAMTKRAEAHRKAGESTEAAHSRMLEADATMRSMYQCYKAAAEPATPEAAPVVKSGPDVTLDALADEYAKEHNVTREQGYVAVLDTQKGAELARKVWDRQ
jgi:antitoxin (DNA-binding transcriptional repressor) of toxin-antitoxin stability system